MHKHIRYAAAIGIALATLIPSLRCAAQDQLPPWTQVEKLVERYLRSNTNYAPGDLISQGDVEPIFNELLRLGFRPADHEELYDAFLPENDYLVGLLRSSAGKAFMRKVSAIPHVYDRLERLAWLPKGRTLLGEIIALPQGASKFALLVEGEGAKAIIQLLADDPRGRNYLIATGHVHTSDELLKKLKTEYDRQTRKKDRK